MKSIVNKVCSNEREYPYLAVGESKVMVLFTSEGTGMCVNTGTSTTAFIGEYDTAWDERKFYLHEGEVVLSN